MFDAISPTYDRLNRLLSFGMDARWRKTACKYLPARTNLHILDLATGTGDQAIALYRANASVRSVTGIDLSKEMLALAQKKAPHIRFLHADAMKMPFSNERFDAATFSFGIRNVVNPLLCLKEIHRILKPKGRCLILEFSMPPNPIRPFALLYLRHIMPHLGGLFSRAPKAYRYLNTTIETFPSGAGFCQLMKEAGFSRLKVVPMAFGCVSLYIGDKM